MNIESYSIPELEGLDLNALKPSEQVAVLLKLCRHYHIADKKKTAELAVRGGEIAEKYSLLTETKEFLQFAAEANHAIGNYVTGLEFTLKHLELEKSDKPKRLDLLRNKGVANFFLGNLSEAMAAFEEGLKLAAQEKNDMARVDNLGYIGMVHQNLKNHQKALDYVGEALHLLEKLPGNESKMAQVLGNLGTIHGYLKHYDQSLKYFGMSAEIDRRTGNHDGLATCLVNIGETYSRLGDFDLALKHFKEMEEMDTTRSSPRLQACCNFYLGNIYDKREASFYDSERAEYYFKKALGIAEKAGLQKLKFEFNHALAELYSAQEKWKEAYKHFEKYHEIEKQVINEDLQTKVSNFDARRELELKNKEHEVINRILLNILPAKIAERIKKGEEEIMERHENATVMFADIVEFTGWSSKLSVGEVAQHLNNIFQLFDKLANQFGVEKIKTIGDAYMCVAGLPEPVEDHALRVANMALAMNEKIKEAYPNGDIKLRIGIHSGEVIAGVIGKNKYAYDLWGDTVNTASRMESHGLPDKIQVTEEFKNLLQGKFIFEDRGEIAMKGKGKVRTWFLSSQHG